MKGDKNSSKKAKAKRKGGKMKIMNNTSISQSLKGKMKKKITKYK